ncbi:LacI family DNA-binding transcriptional regulator [Rhizobium wenxiniae]|uniref:LacI family DNA-binding transcriptional regulator n=1 Tax=Rhizobium wenxiniae TaxID=1737357 RepID=UPI003C1F09CC
MDLKDDVGPTLKDIAEAAGISVTAVSKVLNNRGGVSVGNRERVLKIVEDLGYRGRGGKSSAPDRVAIVMLDRYVTNNAFFSEIVDGVLEAAEMNGIVADVSVVTSERIAAGHDTKLWEGSPHGSILIGLDRKEAIDLVQRAGIPSVIVNGMDRSMRISSVSPDYHFGGWAATQRLLELGHRDIVHVTHPHRESIKRRLDGFRDALEEFGICFDPRNHVLDLGNADLISVNARAVIEQFLAERQTLPTALFCVADIVAIAAIQATRGLGYSVPDDISVIGFDDLSIGAHSSPPLDTVRIDRRQLGRIAVKTLVEKLSGGDLAVKRINVGVELVVRESVTPITPG